jgi:hypothetical protein
MKKQEQIDALRLRIERIEQHFAEQHIPNNFGKCSEKPNGCEQYELPNFVPDWKDAPVDATHLAMDLDGMWSWWTKMPSAYKNNPFGEGWWVSGAREQLAFSAGETTNADRLHPDYWKNSLQERPTKTEPDYTHLLPEGYEFCTEQDAEKWVKVELIPYSTNQSELGYLAYDKSPISDNLKTYYRPIRPIRPESKPDYTHLLPEGYEFCAEGEHDDWVKVKIIPSNDYAKKIEIGSLLMGKFCWDKFKPYYRPIRKTEPDYTHLLPYGYEFCEEADAENWVKVEYSVNRTGELDEYQLGYIVNGNPNILIGTWKPIRPIQYHVAVHEATTTKPDPYTIEKHGDGWAIYKGRDSMHHGANLGQIHDEKLAQYIGGLLKGFKDAEPDPYQVDWSNAPKWADVHCFDKDGTGFWYGAQSGDCDWWEQTTISNFALPCGLDWKQSKRRRGI